MVFRFRRPRASRAGAPFLFAEPVARFWPAAIAVLAAAGAGLATFTAAGVGAGAVPPADLIAARYSTVLIPGSELERAPSHDVAGVRAGPEAGPAKGKPDSGGRLELSYYIGVDFQTVPPGGAQLFEIRCPTRGEQPLTGGPFAPVTGLVAVNSSQTNPQLGFPSRPRAWYQAVVNITSAPLTWKPFVSCGDEK